MAARYHANPTRVAIAWLAIRPGVTAPIASATRVDQLNDLIEGARLELDATSIKRLDEASA